jgi:hypothetical protein
MHSGQLSQVEEEPRSLSGFRAKSYAPTQCSRDLASLTDHLLSEGNPTPPASSAENVLLDRIKRDTAAASALLNAHKTQVSALLAKLRLAAIRNDEAAMASTENAVRLRSPPKTSSSNLLVRLQRRAANDSPTGERARHARRRRQVLRVGTD